MAGWRDAPIVEEQESEWSEAPQVGAETEAAAPPQPSQASRSDYYINQAKKGVAGAAAIPGLALDAVNLRRRAMRAIGTGTGLLDEKAFPIESPFAYTQQIPALANKAMGVENIEAPTHLDKLFGLAVELGLPSLPLAARNIAVAPHKIPAIVAEIGSLFGASVGGNVGERAGGDIGEAVGIATGGLAPTAVPTIMSRVGGTVASKISPAARRAMAEREAGKRLGPAMKSELGVEENMALSDEVTEAINAAVGRGKQINPLAGTPFEAKEPGLGGKFAPTIGARTNAQVVQDLEADTVMGSPERLSRYASRVNENQRVLEEAKGQLLGTKTADTLPRQAASRLTKATQDLNQRLAQVERQQKAVGSATEGGKSQDVGEKLRNQYWTSRGDVKKKFVALYDELYSSADKQGVKVDMSDVRDAVKKIAGADENVYQDMPRTFGKIKREMAGEVELPYPKPQNILQQSANERAQAEAQGAVASTSFKEFHSLWKEVNRDLAAAARTGDTQRYGYLKDLKTSLDAKLKQMEEGGLGDLSSAFREVNQAYGTRYAKVFKEGIGGRIADVGKFGATTDDAKIVEKFFTPDGMDDFTAIYGADKDANKLLKDGILGLFQRSAVDEVTGKIRPGAAEAFLRKNAEVLDKVPEVKALLGNANKLSDALADRSSRLGDAQRSLDKSILARVSKSENVGDLLANASKSPKEMKRLFAIARTKEERVALARSFADELPRIAEGSGMDPYKYLMSQQDTFKPIMDQLGPTHWNNLRIIAGGQTVQSRMQIPGRVDIKRGQDPLFEATGSNARSLVATYLSVLRGRTQPHSELSQIFARFGIKKREQMIDGIMNEAIYDPEMADAIVKVTKGKADDIVANKFRHYVETTAFRTAISTGDNTLDDEKKPEPPKAPATAPKKAPYKSPAAGGIRG